MEEEEEEVSCPDPAAAAGNQKRSEESVRVKRETLRAVLEQCQRALESLSNNPELGEDDGDEAEDDISSSGSNLSRQSWTALCDDREANEVRLLPLCRGFCRGLFGVGRLMCRECHFKA